jgi:hypothetical protein
MPGRSPGSQGHPIRSYAAPHASSAAGHGNPAGPGLLADQRRYLLYYRELIRRLSGGEPVLDEVAKSELNTAMQAFLPDAPLTWMIELGADAVAAELAVNPG